MPARRDREARADERSFGDRAQFTDMAHRCDAAGVWREKADERVGVFDQFQICHDACK